MSDLPDTLPQWIADHVRLYQRDPDKGHLWNPGGGESVLPTLLLTTTGRKSGKERLLPLIYKKVGDDYVIIASKAGAPDHPAWYVNLVANPLCGVQVGHDVFKARARTAEGEERENLWQQLKEVYPPYDDYQKTAGSRRIPVVVLERVG